ncbi:MAG: UDP-N-acetylglucosamine 2-epimerase (non-hydrolyzing) [Euryarchaeota archaeon]|nr:UDP-N-acetylglucosamine 2-epimerase (non-hydrolyzing) [Euryarchaeota archaeon]
MNLKIVTIVGARPQFVKTAVISREIQKHTHIQEIIIHTGQHYDTNMSDIFFQEMQIPVPNYNLGISGSSHGAMTGRMLEEIEKVLLQENPDCVLVYGDTNSTLAGALAAAKLHIPIAHVEAGLRSYNMRMPEEINRILTDRISTWLFCPTDTAVHNLKKEGYTEQNAVIMNVGDVMYDAALFYEKIARPSETISNLLQSMNEFYLATVHRAENTDDISRITDILKALEAISQKKPVILPLHPRTQKLIMNMGIALKNICVIDPVGYFDMITLLKKCSGVFTDSGGVQKEAYFFQKPCVTLRDETEWVELVEYGFNTLVGANYGRILEQAAMIDAKKMDWSHKLYGDGNAAAKIVKSLER